MTRPNPEQVNAIVRQVLQRLLADAPANAPGTGAGGKRSIVDAEIVSRTAPGATLNIEPGTLVTPLARDTALERGVHLQSGLSLPKTSGPADRVVALGADHGGFNLKEQLLAYVAELGWQTVDCGTSGTSSVDYPDYAFIVARMVAEGRARWGIIVDGAGIGSCMVANKVPGIRAALCYDLASASNSREHNHANVLTLGAGLIGPNLARQIVRTWLETPFGPGRHAGRVEKIMAIERRFLKE